MFKKIFVIIASIVLLSNCFNLLTTAENYIHPEILEQAIKAGINTEGLTNLQVKEKLSEILFSGYREKAKAFGIDTKDLTDIQIMDKVLTIENADMIAKAKIGGIMTDGLTYYQVLEAVNARDRENVAKQAVVNPEVLEIADNAGINTEGLTTIELKTKIEELKMAEFRGKAQKYGIDIKDLTDIQIMNQVLLFEKAEVIAKAKNGEIKTDGLTYFQVLEAVDAKEKENTVEKVVDKKDYILEMAKSYGIDTTGLSHEEMKQKINEIEMPSLIKRAQELGINYEGLSHDDLGIKVKQKEIEIMNSTEKN